MRILIIDDDFNHVENLKDFCEAHGWEPSAAYCGADADRVLAGARFDLVILDVTMPGVDGITYCRTLRQRGFTMPVLMLTGNVSIDDRCDGLASGADDYLIKPFSFRELAARIEALIRRTRKTVLTAGDLSLDLEQLTVSREGRVLSVTPTGFRILRALMTAAPAVVPRRQLEEEIWNNAPPDSDSLRANIYLLRQVVDKPFRQKLIRTHQGTGWSVVTEPAS